MASHEGLPTTAGTESGGLLARVSERLSQTLCGFRGHDTLLHFEDERMSLRCVSCGFETPGWELNEVPPTVTVRGDARTRFRLKYVDRSRIDVPGSPTSV
jgi:hypothetical protein